jgi:hypothetical protein
MIRSEFQGDYGDLTPDGLYDREVAALIAQMGDNPAKPQPGVQAIAVFLANRYKVMSLGDLQFLWTPDSQECGGNDEVYRCTYIPGFFTAIVKHNDLRIPQEFAHFDDGRATYYLGFKPTANGQPGFGLLYVNPRARGVFREVALPLLAIGSLVYDWSGQLGYAILGAGNAAAATTLSLEIAMASGLTQLQVAQLVGSAAVGAVTSGGDVGEAVKNTAASYLGAQAGNFVSAAVDSAAAAKITSAAVTAAATGQDVGRAILTAGAPLAAGAATGAITSGSTMDDILFPTSGPATMDDFGYDWQFAPGDTVGDVVVSLDELGITGEVVVDDAALAAAGLSEAALVPDDLGILYNVAGQWVEIPAEEYAMQLYATVSPNRGVKIVGPDNNEVLSELQVSNVTSDADLQTKLLQGLTARCGPTQSCGLTQPSGPPPADRPASLTQPAKETTISGALDYAKVAEALTKSFANIITVIRQVENGTYGRVPSPYGQTGPYGTLRPQQPGVRVQNADGSVTVNNGNGTQTTTKPNGQVVTTRTSVAGGTFGGISSNTLLIAGAGLAALLLLRRK